MPRTKILLLSLAAASFACAAYAAQAGLRLVVDGKLASADVRMIGGKAYVPLADVAKALDMTVTKSGAGYAMGHAGGANELKGFAGKQGDVVFTGKWRFIVLDWKRVESYRPTLMRRNQWEDHYDAKPDEDLIVVSCRIKNGTPKSDELVFPTVAQPMETNNALTDGEEHSYPPVGFDVAESHGAPPGAAFLPGAAIDFKMIFRVPKGTQPKDVVFTALRYDSYALYMRKNDPAQDIRASLRRE